MSKWLPWMCAAMLAGCGGGSGAAGGSSSGGTSSGGSSSGGTSSGGTSSGGTSSGGASSGGTPSPLPAAVQITSPVEGARITGDRTIVVQGTATGTGVTSVTVSVNGGPGSSVPVSAGKFIVPVTLANRENGIAATVQGDLGPATAGPVHVFFPYLALSNFQAATAVIGQPDLTSNSPGTLPYPVGNATSDGKLLYVPETGGDRVLVFQGIPATGASPLFALGPSLDVASGSTGTTPIHVPRGLRAASGRLLVADGSINRVLIFDPAPASALAAGTVVALGQKDLTSSSSGCGQDTLWTPHSVTVVGNQVVVADANNHRVLIWNQVPTSSGAPADVVLGQKDFTHCAQNDETGTGTPGQASARTLNMPTDVWSDGARLYVADSGNNRVLIWNGMPAASQAPADLVLGQRDFTTVSPGTTNARVQHPFYGASNGNQVFVADAWNSRVLVWNTLPKSSGAAADVVLGHADFSNSSPNNGRAPALPGDPTAQTLWAPGGVAALDDALVVTDTTNNRVVIFR